MAIVIFLLSTLGFLLFLVLGVISLIKKNEKVKKNFMISGISLVVMFVAFIAVPVDEQDLAKEEESKPKVEQASAQPQEEEPEPELTEEEKAAQEAKEKADAEAKAKAEEEARLKAEEEEKARQEQLAKEQAEKKANAQPIEYAQLIKNPDRHAGTYVKYKGEIIQIQEGNGLTVIRLAVTPTSYGYDFNDVIWVEYEGYTDYVDGDTITVYGEIFGSHSYTSQAGWDITVPALIAEEFE